MARRQWIQNAALGWVVYEITGSGALLGAVLGVRVIPLILLAPVSGVAADRFNRRRLMQASQAPRRGGVTCRSAPRWRSGMVSIWMLFVFTHPDGRVERHGPAGAASPPRSSSCRASSR